MVVKLEVAVNVRERKQQQMTTVLALVELT